MLQQDYCQKPIPTQVGIGFKHQHLDELLNTPHHVRWLEVHPENYMVAGGPNHQILQRVRADYPLSMHGVGLSLGSADGLNAQHLSRLKDLVDRYQPALVSEHLAWTTHGGQYSNDLLPMPYSEQSLQVFCRNIEHYQETIGRQILVENPSIYLPLENDLSEVDFLNETCARTGAGLLLDVNNIAVSGHNLSYSTSDYLAQLNLDNVQEIHVAGHGINTLADGSELRIDDHGHRVSDEVWQLLDDVIKLRGKALPVLVEWDTNIPEFAVLDAEAARVAAQLEPWQENSKEARYA